MHNLSVSIMEFVSDLGRCTAYTFEMLIVNLCPLMWLV